MFTDDFFEEFVMEQVQAGISIISLYPLADDEHKSDFEKWLAKR